MGTVRDGDEARGDRIKRREKSAKKRVHAYEIYVRNNTTKQIQTTIGNTVHACAKVEILCSVADSRDRRLSVLFRVPTAW